MKSLGEYNRFNPKNFKKKDMSQTLGQKRVRLDFNPSANNTVHQVKKLTADLIDLLEAYKNDLLSTNAYTVDPKVFSETLRLIDFAQTAAEEASQWGVKALTSEINVK